MGHKSEADHTVANLTCSNSQMISQSPTLHASFRLPTFPLQFSPFHHPLLHLFFFFFFSFFPESVNKLDFQNEFNFKLECLSEVLPEKIQQNAIEVMMDLDWKLHARFPSSDFILWRVRILRLQYLRFHGGGCEFIKTYLRGGKSKRLSRCWYARLRDD